ncbi:MAG: transposase [Spirosoma sp.]|nr:transposase [Spirosoma sp.]
MKSRKTVLFLTAPAARLINGLQRRKANSAKLNRVAGASVEILALPSQGKSVDEIWRTHNIATATFYNWRNKYGGRDTARAAPPRTPKIEGVAGR